MTRTKILVIDDELQIVQLMRLYLEREGFQVLAAYDGLSALEIFRRERPALVLLDLMLPQVDGLEVARQLRRESDVLILMLTARADEVDRVTGLEVGADDYIVKSLSSPREIVARVRAALRRANGLALQNKTTRLGDLTLDAQRHEVRRRNRLIELTPSEFAILQTLLSQPGRVFGRRQLLERLQGITYAAYDRAVDSHIKHLRKKIEDDPKNPRYVLTVHGLGYKAPERAEEEP